LSATAVNNCEASTKFEKMDWLVAGLIPGVSREPLKKLEPNPEDLLKLLHGWRDEAIKAGRPIPRGPLSKGNRTTLRNREDSHP
jgi:hypothetical protein